MGLRALPRMPVRAAVRQLSVPVVPVRAAHPLQQQMSNCMHIADSRHTQSDACMCAMIHMLISCRLPFVRSTCNLFLGVHSHFWCRVLHKQLNCNHCERHCGSVHHLNTVVLCCTCHVCCLLASTYQDKGKEQFTLFSRQTCHGCQLKTHCVT